MHSDCRKGTSWSGVFRGAGIYSVSVDTGVGSNGMFSSTSTVGLGCSVT